MPRSTSNLSCGGNKVGGNNFNDQSFIQPFEDSLHELDINLRALCKNLYQQSATFLEFPLFCPELEVQFKDIQDLGRFVFFTVGRDAYQGFAGRFEILKGFHEFLDKTFGHVKDLVPDYVRFLSTQLDVLDMYRRLRPSEPNDHMLTDFMGMVEARRAELLEDGPQSEGYSTLSTRPDVNSATQKGVTNEKTRTEGTEQNQAAYNCQKKAFTTKKKLHCELKPLNFIEMRWNFEKGQFICIFCARIKNMKSYKS